MWHLTLTWEPFIFSFGLIASSICCVSGIRTRRSSSRCNRFVRDEHPTPTRAADNREPLPRRRRSPRSTVVSDDDPSPQRTPLPRRRTSNLPYDPLNLTEPPLTVYSQGRPSAVSNIFSIHGSGTLQDATPTSPISSQDALYPDKSPARSKSPIGAVPPLLRTKSLPAMRRRRRHHRPITCTPTVTLIEAPSPDDDSSSSPAVPSARLFLLRSKHPLRNLLPPDLLRL